MNIKSLNGASYISTVTGIEARITADENGSNYYSFDYDERVVSAYNFYKQSLARGTELSGDINKFMSYIRKYKSMTNEFKRSQRK